MRHAPFIANLFLYFYFNFKFTFKLSRYFRYLDDHFKGLNDLVHKNIYPCELVLSCTDNLGMQAQYLDLSLSFEFFFTSKQFEKKKKIRFFI